MAPKQVKRQLFELLPEEVGNASKLVKFAETVPTFQKTGCEDRDEDLKLKRTQFQKSINLLWRNPDLCWKNVMWLEEKIHAKANKCGADMFKTISTLGALDETWACNWIVKSSRITMDTLEAACDADPESWKQICVFVLKASLLAKIPQECKVKAVMGNVLDARVVQVGSRFEIFHDETLCTDDWMIDWRSHGVFEPQWVQGC